MGKKWIKKIFKIAGLLLLIVFIGLTILFYKIFSPKSDSEILETLQTETNHPFVRYVQYKDNPVRTIHMQKDIDAELPTLVLIHGSPGSALDFKKYLLDKELNKKYNIITYDRIGYGEENRGKVVSSLEEEVKVLNKVIKDIKTTDIILAGYSYGGTTALASQKKYKKKLLLAPAVRGDLEPMFWAIKLYQWKLTRFLVPKVFQAATEEKLRHRTELVNYENQWDISNTKIISIHGKLDRIVPYQNSIFLENKLDPAIFKLIPLEKGRHDLIWTNFDEIKKVFLKVAE
jgi:pimeloyl-ACP methyl ester carboxylesterase